MASAKFIEGRVCTHLCRLTTCGATAILRILCSSCCIYVHPPLTSLKFIILKLQQRSNFKKSSHHMRMCALDFYEWGVKSASFVIEDILIHNVGLIMSLMIMKVAVRPRGPQSISTPLKINNGKTRLKQILRRKWI